MVGSARITRSLNELVPMSIAANRFVFGGVLAIVFNKLKYSSKLLFIVGQVDNSCCFSTR